MVRLQQALGATCRGPLAADFVGTIFCCACQLKDACSLLRVTNKGKRVTAAGIELGSN